MLDLYSTEENICDHKVFNKGVCISCGVCFEEYELKDSYIEKINNKSHSQQIFMKYLYKDPIKQYLSKIKRILIPLNLESYIDPVNDLVLKTNFKGRMKAEDKIILSIFHLLKMNSFPISLDDLLKYSSTDKYRLLKIYRNTFSFIKKSDEYFQGIYQRTLDLLSKIEINSSKGNFKEFLSLIDKFKSTSPKLLCLAYLCEKNEISSMKVAKEFEEFNYSQIQYVRKKIPKNNLLT